MLPSSRISKPAPPHKRLFAPAVCMCVDCCKIVLDSRCPTWTIAPNAEGNSLQCGDVKGHRGAHTTFVSTTYIIAEERVRLDGRKTVKGDSDA